jgi:hypothetical protein
MIENINTRTLSDKNQHVRNFLSNYIVLPYSPHYAVLLTGPWGIGKTYLIKKFLKEKFGDEREYAYVSLQGIATREELAIAVFQACFPNVIWKNVELLGPVGKTALKYVGINPDIQLSGLPKPQKDLYVFDDLERCDMPINASLGYINDFVEHEGKKVVIVANEQEIDDKREYARRREKLIGKVFEIQSVLDEALPSFIESVGDPLCKSLLGRKTGDISIVYNQSGLNNLRLLQQTIWDFSRFFSALSERHRENDEAVTTLLRSFFALSFEFKAGRLRQEDLKKWFSTTMDYMILRHNRDGDKERKPSPCEAAIERYPDIDLSGTFLSPKLLEDIFIKGIVDYSEIQAYLDSTSPYFVDRGVEPAWRTVWHYTERTEEEFTKAYKKMGRSSRRESSLNLAKYYRFLDCVYF